MDLLLPCDSGGSRENPFPYLVQVPEATCIPWLMTPPSFHHYGSFPLQPSHHSPYRDPSDCIPGPPGCFRGSPHLKTPNFIAPVKSLLPVRFPSHRSRGLGRGHLRGAVTQPTIQMPLLCYSENKEDPAPGSPHALGHSHWLASFHVTPELAQILLMDPRNLSLALASPWRSGLKQPPATGKSDQHSRMTVPLAALSRHPCLPSQVSPAPLGVPPATRALLPGPA